MAVRNGITQLDLVLESLRFFYPRFVTLRQIAADTGFPETSVPAISARIRDLRKREHGGHVIVKRFKDGVVQYRMES